MPPTRTARASASIHDPFVRVRGAHRGHTLYLLDELTTGLHPADVRLLTRQLHGLVDAGNTVILVEHDMDVVAAADWVMDLGPAGGDAGGTIVAAGDPADVARSRSSRTGPYLAAALRAASGGKDE